MRNIVATLVLFFYAMEQGYSTSCSVVGQRFIVVDIQFD